MRYINLLLTLTLTLALPLPKAIVVTKGYKPYYILEDAFFFCFGYIFQRF